MTTKRVKKTGPALKTRAEMEACVGEICRLTIVRDGLLVELDEQLQAIRTQYEERLAAVTGDLEAEMGMAEDWATNNAGEFGEKKSIEMTHGLVGFRTGTPKLKTVRGFTWDRVLEKLTAFNLVAYIRVKREPDKEALIADRRALVEKFPALGVQVVQEESFFVEVKREENKA